MSLNNFKTCGTSTISRDISCRENGWREGGLRKRGEGGKKKRARKKERREWEEGKDNETRRKGVIPSNLYGKSVIVNFVNKLRSCF